MVKYAEKLYLPIFFIYLVKLLVIIDCLDKMYLGSGEDI